MSNSNSFEGIFSDIIYDYFNTFVPVEPVIPDYRIVEDIASEYLALRPDVLAKSDASVESLSAYNGFAVPPKEIGGIFTVLINKNVLMENVQNKISDWVGTIAHETTHVQDFAQYAKIVGAYEYEEILRIDKHGMFNIWTEIHARSKGYFFTRKYTLGPEFMKSELLVQDIKNREIPTQWGVLYEKYHATDNGYEQAYLVAQYIGRLYTLQQLYPEAFNDRWVRNHFGVNVWMTDLFLFFKKYPTLESVSGHFGEMKVILGQNFRGI